MADERVKVCDSKSCPRKGKQVKHYKIDFPEQVFQADLCRQHAQPLLDFIVGFPAHFVVKLRSGTRGTGIQLHTVEEIEEMKERGKKPPR